MSLKLFSNNRWIREHEPSRAEIERLLALADRDIQQSQTPGLGPEWRFDIAYNAALQLATAALAACGFRAERQNKHLRTIETLAFTVGVDEPTVSLLDRCRRKRHVAIYERVDMISDHEAQEIIKTVLLLRELIAVWLRDQHPNLVE
jgi:hypothetical protein